MFDFKSPFIIADIGSSWRRFESPAKNKKCAIQHIEAAAECGVSAVKFQMFTSKELYGFKHGDDKYALPRKWLPELAKAAKRNHVEFMCTAFSDEGVKYVDKFVNYHKVASAEMCDPEIMVAVAKTNKQTFVSTGAHTTNEIARCEVGYMRGLSFSNFGFLECVADYPALNQDYSLGLIRSYPNFVGLSDHTTTENREMLALSIGAGAFVFEKHFAMLDYSCADENEYCPDDLHSICEPETKAYVELIKKLYTRARKIEKPSKNEFEMVSIHNRRLIAIRDIKKNEKLKMNENFGSFRSIKSTPADGPEFITDYHGMKSRVVIAKGQGITKGMLYN